MNTLLKKYLTTVIIVIIALLLWLSYIQYWEGPSLRKNPKNNRVLYSEYLHRRGQIDARNELIAYSQTVKAYIRQIRIYPDKLAESFAPITGYYSPWFGRSGLEYSYDSILSGNDSRLFGTHFLDELAGHDPRGGSVTTTIDSQLQLMTYNTMKNGCGGNSCIGAAVAIEPSTGKILALVSTPSYNPNLLVGQNSNEARSMWNSLNKDPNTPLLDRALQKTYPASSTFEIPIIALALNQGILPHQLLNQPPELDNNSSLLSSAENNSCFTNYNIRSKKHSDLNLSQAFAHSCDEVFSNLMNTKIHQPQENLRSLASNLHFDLSVFQLPLPFTNSILETWEDKTSQQGSLPEYARVTPLTNAVLAASIANHGILMHPYCIDDIKQSDLTVVEKFHPQVQDKVFSPQIATTLTQLMQNAEENTPGYRTHSYKIASKTGYIKHGADHLSGEEWYIAFAGNNQAKIAISVIIENDKIQTNQLDSGYATNIGRTMIKNALGGD